MKHLLFNVIFLTLSCVYAVAQDFCMQSGKTVNVYMPKAQKPVANTALEMFADDVHRVLGSEVSVVRSAKKADIVCSIDTNLTFEGFMHYISGGTLYIHGADSHGLAYGLLEVSRMLGVSPWEYWADCVPNHADSFILPQDYITEQHPHVAYRGIFINDEDWGLNPWATSQEPEAWTVKSGRIKGAIGPKVNEKIFQLLLRLRANYYWPAMHECSQPFFTISDNREMAKKYGIYIGGSHCEPMATSPAAEWAMSGEGEYNYVTNRDNVQNFWKKRLDEVKDQEIVYTLGMRGVHDGAMQGVKTMDDKVKYLQMVIDDQRDMLAKTTGIGVPQVFVPYKEVLDIYKNGLRVPDDVTLMWTDDNYGYIRHFPDDEENARKGGNGLYYHCSYWGRPHDYLWLNSMPLTIMHNQLQEAYNRGIRSIWVLNVGDIKPSELQTEYFMQLAWNGNETTDFLSAFMQREFGEEWGSEAAKAMDTYFAQASLCKPEFMAGTRVEESDKAYWNTVRRMPGDWDKKSVANRVAQYREISDKVEAVYAQLPSNRRDAFFQLVKYPVQAATQMSLKFLCPELCEQAYDSIQSLSKIYNNVCASGKWKGIMEPAPRNLAVFQKVSPAQLPEYPDLSEWKDLDGTETNDSAISFELDGACYSVTIQVRLLPTHPVKGQHLTLAVRVDEGEWQMRNYETYDRSEEWKQNVLRGYAERTFTLPVSCNSTRHTLEFHPMSEGVFLMPPHQRFFIKR